MNNSPSADAAERYRTLSSRFTGLVEAVPADRWDAPSPCAEWTARDVFAHVVDTERDLLDRMPFPPAPTTEGLDVLSAWSVIRARVQEALDNPHEAGHTYDGMFGQTTFARTVDQFYSLDLVVHAWDIATATGLEPFRPMPSGEVQTIMGALVPIADTMRQPGVFGRAVEVPSDADPQSKLLGLLGRHA